MATVFGDALIVANVGDSDAVLCRSGLPHMLSYQHKASDFAERQRIVNSGGTVFMSFGSMRVAGMLEVRWLQVARRASRTRVYMHMDGCARACVRAYLFVSVCSLSALLAYLQLLQSS